MSFARTLVAAIALLAASAAAQATTINLAPNGDWKQFNIDVDSYGTTQWVDNLTGEPGYVGNGSPLSFSFTLATTGILSVVDASFAGDTFTLQLNDGASTQTVSTSAVSNTATFDLAADAGTDFSAAMADHANFSYSRFTLGPGSYTLTGFLAQSVMLDASTPLNSTVGGVSLVPEPGSLALLLAGVTVVASLSRRRISA